MFKYHLQIRQFQVGWIRVFRLSYDKANCNLLKRFLSGPVVVTRDDTFEVNFRIRSNDTQGLIFYGTNSDQSNFLSVSMDGGNLYVRTEPGGAQIKTDSINDAEWHVITVSRDRGKLVVNIDDDHEYEYVEFGPLVICPISEESNV